MSHGVIFTSPEGLHRKPATRNVMNYELLVRLGVNSQQVSGWQPGSKLARPATLGVQPYSP
jgi:hypothetical protein